MCSILPYLIPGETKDLYLIPGKTKDPSTKPDSESGQKDDKAEAPALDVPGETRISLTSDSLQF